MVRYNISGAEDVTLLESQTEHPYWNRNVLRTPACDAKAVIVEKSSDVIFWGVIWCSWFCHLENGLTNITANNATSVFGVWSTGATDSVVGDLTIKDALFTADILA